MQKTRTIILSYILLELSLLITFHKGWVFFVMFWCKSGVWLQDLPFIDNRHLGSIPSFQRFPCSRWPPLDIGNIFYKLCSTQQLVWAPLFYLPSFMSTVLLIFKMADVPANFKFQIRSIAKNVLHDTRLHCDSIITQS